jgi:zinc transport system substrate-binding protein
MLKRLFLIVILTYCIIFLQLFAKDTIIVSIPPQKYFIEQIAHNNFNINVMMDDHLFTAYYKPSMEQYLWTENAKYFFTIGLEDENQWLKIIKRKNKTIKIFDTKLNIKEINGDNHIWLDPYIVKIQAKNIYHILKKIDNQNNKFYQKNYLKFVNKISGLDYQIRALFRKHKKNNFMVFNSAWGYFSKRYRIKQINILTNILSSKKDNIINIVNQIQKSDSTILLIPKYYFPLKTYKQIKKTTKTTIIPVSPFEYNWHDNLLNIAKKITYQSR